MTLRDTVAKWHAAMCLLDENRLDEAAHKLLEIQKPSARIVYNLGLICMLQHRYRDAIEYFNTSTDQDNYLAIAFYQRGLSYYEIQRFDAARSDFLSARSMIRNEGIDYKQLGAEVILTPQLLDHCITVTEGCLSKKQMDGGLQALPVRDCVLRPQKALVDSLVKQTFLGNAKVISSAKEEDIVTAKETRKAHNPGVIKWTSVSMPSSPAPNRHALSKSSTTGHLIPSPPKRPPPRLPSGTTHSQQLRLKSKSLEDMTANKVVNNSLIAEERPKMGHMVLPPKPKPVVFNASSSVTPFLSQDMHILAHAHSGNPDRVGTHLVDNSIVRNHADENLINIPPGRLHIPDKQTPSRLVLNHAQECAFLAQNEERNLGHISSGHAAQMKLLFEKGEKQEEKFSQHGIRLTTQKCSLESELQETFINSQKKRLDMLQQSKSGDSQQNRTNIKQSLSLPTATASGSSIQKSPKPIRPPPPKFSK
ncbi:hypothetical protein BsWGS_09013 [Bradybaena similaris]